MQRSSYLSGAQPRPVLVGQSTTSWLSWFAWLLIGAGVVALIAMGIATLVIVARNERAWKGESCDDDDPICILNAQDQQSLTQTIASQFNSLLAQQTQQLTSAMKGGNGNTPPPATRCTDTADAWPAAEFPTRDTDSEAATFCSLCKSLSVPVCSSGVCRIGLANVDSVSPTVVTGTGTNIHITALGYYRFQVVLTASVVCPVRRVEVAMWDETSNTQLGDSVLVNGFATSELFLDRIVEADHHVSLRLLDSKQSDRVAAYGRVLRSSMLDRLLHNTEFDAQTRVAWIPFRPDSLPPVGASPLFPGQFPNDTVTYPWFANVIPAGVLPGAPPTLPAPLPPLQALPNRDGYTKYRGVPTSLDVFFGRNTFVQDGTEETIDIFDMALEARGLDRSGRRNHRKMIYMTALTSEVSLNYVPKIQSFVNRVYSAVTTNDGPLLSTFKAALLDFFIDIHWGEDPQRPEFVREYFRIFLDIVGFGDTTFPGRNEAFLYGADNQQAVRDYARGQTIKVIAAQDKTSIVYWWNLAGLPVDAQLTEAVHNVVAFSQFNHHLFLVVRDKLSGTPFPLPPPANLIQYNFLNLYASLGTDELKMNLIRETYRLLLPNGNDFSAVVEANPSGQTVKARHLRLPLQLAAYTLLAGGNQLQGVQDFVQLNLNQYNDPVLGADYTTNFTDLNCPDLTPTDASHFYPEDQWDLSPLDGETLVDKCNPRMFPVFKLLKYFPFGAGYRRCAGEAFNMIVSKLMFDRFATMEFEYRPVAPDTALVTLAPFVAKPDNIYFKKSLVTVP